MAQRRAAERGPCQGAVESARHQRQLLEGAGGWGGGRALVRPANGQRSARAVGRASGSTAAGGGGAACGEGRRDPVAGHVSRCWGPKRGGKASYTHANEETCGFVCVCVIALPARL